METLFTLPDQETKRVPETFTGVEGHVHGNSFVSRSASFDTGTQVRRSHSYQTGPRRPREVS